MTLPDLQPKTQDALLRLRRILRTAESTQPEVTLDSVESELPQALAEVGRAEQALGHLPSELAARVEQMRRETEAEQAARLATSDKQAEERLVAAVGDAKAAAEAAVALARGEIEQRYDQELAQVRVELARAEKARRAIEALARRLLESDAPRWPADAGRAEGRETAPSETDDRPRRAAEKARAVAELEAAQALEDARSRATTRDPRDID